MEDVMSHLVRDCKSTPKIRFSTIDEDAVPGSAPIYVIFEQLSGNSRTQVCFPHVYTNVASQSDDVNWCLRLSLDDLCRYLFVYLGSHLLSAFRCRCRLLERLDQMQGKASN